MRFSTRSCRGRSAWGAAYIHAFHESTKRETMQFLTCQGPERLSCVILRRRDEFQVSAALAQLPSMTPRR